MPDPLRPFVLALVLLNVVFVQLTGIVSGKWLLPLYALTLASPWLTRLQHKLAYRLLWNVGVIVLSLLLVHHAVTTGLLHMLEDGLVLAAVCQVHVLNNAGSRQKPDLLFFNSFLIVFVTSFFCQDSAYSLAFLAYAAVLLPALQLFAVLRGDPAPGDGVVRAVLRDSLPRTAMVLAATGTVFLLWPRDFTRDGWLESQFDLAGTQLTVGFAEEVRLDRAGRTTQSDQEVMRIRLRQGEAAAVPNHWRGATFVDFRLAGWVPEPTLAGTLASAFDHPWRRDGASGWQRIGGKPEALLDVHLLDPNSLRLFLPLNTSDTALVEAERPTVLPRPDGTMTFAPPHGEHAQPFSYRLTASGAPPRLPRITERAMRRLTFVDDDLLPREIEDISRHILARLPAPADEQQVTEAFRQWLSQNRRYALPGEPGAARGIAEFLTGSAGGHCEYFATTLALMLRSTGIPCRLITGYLTDEWDPSGREMIVRRRHAHAWVEALLPGRGWVTVDATPAASHGAGAATTLWDQFTAASGNLWRLVTGFDQDSRQATLEWLSALPGYFAGLPQEHPLALLLVVALLVLLRLGRRRAEPAPVRQLRATIRRIGLHSQPGETPRELLRRASAAALPPGRIDALTSAVHAHEMLRYGDPGHSPPC